MYSVSLDSSIGGTNPQSGSATSSTSGGGGNGVQSSSSNIDNGNGKAATAGTPRRPMNPHSKNHRLPPLFYLMEMGDWQRATERAISHPKEVATWASLRTKYTTPHKISSAKRLALHHACFKLRSTVSTTVPIDGSSEDPFIQVCRFILTLVQIYPEAATMRESRHGCLPLHLASFASCTKPSGTTANPNGAAVATAVSPNGDVSLYPQDRPARTANSSVGSFLLSPSSLSAMSFTSNPAVVSPSATSTSVSPVNTKSSVSSSSPSLVNARPPTVVEGRRSSSESSANTIHSNMTNMMEQEFFGGSQGHTFPAHSQPSHHRHQQPCQLQRATSNTTAMRTVSSPRNNVSVSMGNNILISEKREAMAVKVLNALLDAFPKGIRMDSEGGRMPLHMACAGRATPRVVSTLITAYPAAARHRNKDGFLPLHVAAHWGISHPNVAISLLKTYPDATFGRNRWERTPLEEALCMAGENGRPHQSALVRSLRKHPSYWTRPSDLFETKSPRDSRRIVDTDETIPSNEDDEDEDPFRQEGPHFVAPDGEAYKSKSSLFGKKSKEAEEEGVEPVSYLVMDLPTLIRNQNWNSVLRRLEYNPGDAEEELRTTTRGGFVAGLGFLPLHYACERRPPAEVVEALIQSCPGAVMTRAMPGGCLPLHTACTWFASPAAIDALIMADRASCKIRDELGNTALHCACFSGTSIPVLEALVRAYPKAVLARNHQGSLPEDICDRLRHDNRRQALYILAKCKEDLMARKHRKTASLSSSADIGSKAVDLDEVDEGLAVPPPQTGDDSDDKGFEVAYERKNGDDLVWV